MQRKVLRDARTFVEGRRTIFHAIEVNEHGIEAGWLLYEDGMLVKEAKHMRISSLWKLVEYCKEVERHPFDAVTKV